MSQASTTHMGRHMLTACWLVALALLTLLFGRWEDAQINPNQQPRSDSTATETRVTLAANRQHHYLAKGTINGREVTFLLDTGATHVSVPAHLAKTLRLERGSPMTSTTANGQVTVYATRIGALRLGDIQLFDLRGSINPGMTEDEILLGMSALKQVEWHQKGDQLTLIQHHP
jgi:aspartyl protease family protein